MQQRMQRSIASQGVQDRALSVDLVASVLRMHWAMSSGGMFKRMLEPGGACRKVSAEKHEICKVTFWIGAKAELGVQVRGGCKG